MARDSRDNGRVRAIHHVIAASIEILVSWRFGLVTYRHFLERHRNVSFASRPVVVATSRPGRRSLGRAIVEA